MATKKKTTRKKKKSAADIKDAEERKQLHSLVDRFIKKNDVQTFGLCSQEDGRKHGQLSLHLAAFEKGLTKEDGGLGKYEHLKAAANLLLPSLSWNPWLEQQLQSLCDPRYAFQVGDQTIRSVNWTGCAAAGKTFAAGLYSLLWWLPARERSIVVLTSTTKDMIRKRVWSVIQSLVSTAHDIETGERYHLGYMLESSTSLQYSDPSSRKKRDDKHAIFAMAVAHGETQKAIHNLKGIHAERILLVVDEANGTPEAILETIPNMRKGCRDFTVLVIGNAQSHLDPHGMCCEPERGWASITVEDTSWKTSGVRKWQIPPGICLHFSGQNSPNVVAGKTMFPYLYSWEDWQHAKDSRGEGDIQFWAMDLGFWSPEGTANTVLNEVMVEQYGGYDVAKFARPPRKLAFLDPAFGGDDCILQFAELGPDHSNTDILLLTETITIHPHVSSTEEIDYQVAHRAIKECKQRDVEPSCFGIDSTGTGRGVHAIISHEWGSSIKGVEAGGKPSDLPASTSDTRPSHQVYDRRISELWFSVREFLKQGQLKGLYRECVAQFCTRTFDIAPGNKLRVQTKDKYKATFGRSPDHADAVAGVVEVARLVGAGPSLQRRRVEKEWNEFARQEDDEYESEMAYSETYQMEGEIYG